MNTFIYTFINKRTPRKDNKIWQGSNPLVGCVVAHKNLNDSVGIGWSRCAVNRGDNFNKDTALAIALGRADKGSVDFPPHSMSKAIETMQSRAAKYFKGSVVRSINSNL